MKSILKLNLFFSFFILGHALSFAQGTCGEVVPFASEPVVNGCEVTYVMDLSIGVNWILYPGNGLPQSSSVSSSNNNGSNVHTEPYENVQGVIYPNITYYDANWNVVCSSLYPVTIDCPPVCGFASEPVVDGCCVTYVMDTSIGVNWILQLQEGDNPSVTERTVTSFSNGGSNTVMHCYNPGSETALVFITYIDETGIGKICESSFDIILEDCEPTPEPCRLASEPVIDGCCVTYEMDTSIGVNWILQLQEGDNPFITERTETSLSTSGSNTVMHCYDPGSETALVFITYADQNWVDICENSFEITLEGCDGNAGPRANTLEDNKLTGVSIFPNPVVDRLTINAQGQAIQTIQLFDVNNRLLLDKRLNEENIYSLDLSQIQTSGIYYLQIIADNNFYSKKVIIQK